MQREFTASSHHFVHTTVATLLAMPVLHATVTNTVKRAPLLVMYIQMCPVQILVQVQAHTA